MTAEQARSVGDTPDVAAWRTRAGPDVNAAAGLPPTSRTAGQQSALDRYLAAAAEHLAEKLALLIADEHPTWVAPLVERLRDSLHPD